MGLIPTSRRFFPRLMHAAICGAALTVFLGILEACAALVQHPFHHDPALIGRVFISNLKLGALLGVFSFLALPLFCTRKDRRHPGLQTALFIFSLLIAASFYFKFTFTAGAQELLPVAIFFALHQLLRIVIRKKTAWMLASLFTPLSSMAFLLFGTLISSLSFVIPEIPPSPFRPSNNKSTAAFTSKNLPANKFTKPDFVQPQHLVVVNIPGCNLSRFGFGGNIRPTTPTIDRLAREGVQFSQINYPPQQGHLLFQSLASELQKDGWLCFGFRFGRGQQSASSNDAGGFTRFFDLERTSIKQNTIANRIFRLASPNPKPQSGPDRLLLHAKKHILNAKESNTNSFMYVELGHCILPINPPAHTASKFLAEGVKVSDGLGNDASPDARESLLDAELLAADLVIKDLVEMLETQDLFEDCLFMVTSNPSESLPDSALILRHSMSLKAQQNYSDTTSIKEIISSTYKLLTG